MEGQARISADIVARYAADAAREAAGVAGLVESQLHRHSGVRVTGERERPEVVVHVRAAWGAPLQQLGRDVQARVAGYLARMADVRPAAIDVVVEEVEAP
jgi:uncharacterized alkaline shock family protein YloU